jgi:RHS repeat-associated protein
MGIPVRVQSPPSFAEGPVPDKARWKKALSEKSFSIRNCENSQQNQHIGAKSPTTHLGPYGELIRVSGPNGKINPVRFSTKYNDDETGLVVYEYRFYNASNGRWLNKDPLGERGGLKLYSFVYNNPVPL